MSREEWLSKVTEVMRKAFDREGHGLPEKINIACAVYNVDKPIDAIGHCQMLGDRAMICISPRQKTAVDAGETLVHELVHAALRCQHAHTKPFRDLGKKVGLKIERGSIGRSSPTPELTRFFEDVVKWIGPYPAPKNVITVETDIEHLSSLIFAHQVGVETCQIRERRMYHRQTRELRIVYTDAEVAALGPWWWEWKGLGR